LIELILIVWTAYYAVNYPHDGIIDIDPTGRIFKLDSLGEENSLQEDDIVISVDGKPLLEAVPYYADKETGEEVELLLLREGKNTVLTIKLYEPPIDTIRIYIMPVIVALIFWGVGVVVLAFKPADHTLRLFFLFNHAIAMLLATGSISWIGPPWASGLFNILLWMVGPLAVHFHLNFPQIANFRYQRGILAILYLLALAGGIPYLVYRTTTILTDPRAEPFLAVSRLFLTLNLIIVLWLVINAFRHATSPAVRGKLRIVFLGGILSIFPFIAFVILPDSILGEPLLPFEIGFLFLGILPLTYGYSIIRHRLIEIDRHVNRGATFILVFSLLSVLYAVLYWIINSLPSIAGSGFLSTTIVVLIMSIVFPALFRRAQRIVDTAFYGSWYDYRSAVSQITQGLEQITDLSELGKTVSHRLVKILQLEDACLFLKDLEGGFSVIEVAPTPGTGETNKLAFTALPKNSLSYLLNIGVTGKTALRNALSEVKLSPEEKQLLDSDQIYLWVPVIGHGQVLGLLALGSKLGGDVFSGEDMDIMRIVSRQLGPLIENIHLVTRLRQYAAELEQRVEERTAELHAEKERVEAVLSSVGDGVFVTDLKGRILTANRAFEDQSGFSESEVIGQPMYAFLDSQDELDRSFEIQEALRSESSWSGELFAHRKGGRSYDVNLTLEPFRDQKGEILGYVGSQRDITQYKELERLKDQFILEVSHELRTPVTNMGLFAELMERGKPEKKAEYMAILKSEINLLMKMIEDILDLSRLEVGKYKKSSFTEVDLNLLVDQVVAAHQPLAQESGLDLSFYPDIDLPRISGDQNQIARVLTNLLSNAIRYTPSGYVRVRTYTQDSGVWVEVEDTGIGIDSVDFPHIFERFYRGQKVSQSKIIGSGLGLAIVNEIVQLHDGRVDWVSKSGEGSTFRVWFPVEIQLVHAGIDK
jgi:two-component system phosphate regulon sensor histidine kinase PhoR